jgi:tRNA A22 N-methylase
LVFSEGLLEHFKDMQPIVDEMCRISKKYVLVLQPNHTTASLRRWLYRLFEILFVSIFRREHVYEIPYTIEDYEKGFKIANFKLIKTFDLVAKSGWGLLFKRIG